MDGPFSGLNALVADLVDYIKDQHAKGHPLAAIRAELTEAIMAKGYSSSRADKGAESFMRIAGLID